MDGSEIFLFDLYATSLCTDVNLQLDRDERFKIPTCWRDSFRQIIKYRYYAIFFDRVYEPRTIIETMERGC